MPLDWCSRHRLITDIRWKGSKRRMKCFKFRKLIAHLFGWWRKGGMSVESLWNGKREDNSFLIPLNKAAVLRSASTPSHGIYPSVKRNIIILLLKQGKSVCSNDIFDVVLPYLCILIWPLLKCPKEDQHEAVPIPGPLNSKSLQILYRLFWFCLVNVICLSTSWRILPQNSASMCLKLILEI